MIFQIQGCTDTIDPVIKSSIVYIFNQPALQLAYGFLIPSLRPSKTLAKVHRFLHVHVIGTGSIGMENPIPTVFKICPNLVARYVASQSDGSSDGRRLALAAIHVCFQHRKNMPFPE